MRNPLHLRAEQAKGTLEEIWDVFENAIHNAFSPLMMADEFDIAWKEVCKEVETELNKGEPL